MKSLFIKLLSLVLIGLLPATSFAQIKLPRLLSDGVVLQRDVEAKLWGWADHDTKVVAFLNGKVIGSALVKQGEWQISLPPQQAGGPHKLRFEASNVITINDVYFGDVWVASGQSNMQTPMYRIEEMFPSEVANADLPLLRQFTAPRKFNFSKPQKDYDAGQWESTDPVNVRNHSAVAYFFGKKIHQGENVPIGILSANMGGSQAECWMSEQALKAYKPQHQRAKMLQDEEHLASLIEADNKDAKNWYQQLDNNDLGLTNQPVFSASKLDDSQWKTLFIPGEWHLQGLNIDSGTVWFRKTFWLPPSAAGKDALLRLGTIVDADQTFINGVEVGNTSYRYPPRRYSVKPGVIKPGENTLVIRARVNNKGGQFVPEMPYYLRVGEHQLDLTGEWKYRIGKEMEAPPKPLRYVPYNEPLGCFNAILAPLFNLKIKGVIWYQGESNTGRAKEYETVFPHMIRHWRKEWGQGDFPFLFVQLANYMKAESQPAESEWAELRFAQFKSLAENNTAMAVTIDVGNWNDLHPMDKKSVGERLALAALALAYNHEGEYSGPLFSQAKVEDNKVMLSFNHIGSGLMAKGGELKGFALADKNGKYRWAKSNIVKDQVMVWHPDIAKPVKLRYAWANNPKSANLYNQQGLPASPFEVELEK